MYLYICILSCTCLCFKWDAKNLFSMLCYYQGTLFLLCFLIYSRQLRLQSIHIKLFIMNFVWKYIFFRLASTTGLKLKISTMNKKPKCFNFLFQITHCLSICCLSHLLTEKANAWWTALYWQSKRSRTLRRMCQTCFAPCDQSYSVNRDGYLLLKKFHEACKIDQYSSTWHILLFTSRFSLTKILLIWWGGSFHCICYW